MSYFVKAEGPLRKTILADVDMTEESLKSDIEKLKEWISKQPHLPQETNESLLGWFIIGCKSLERAKEKLDGYYTARANNPTLFSERNSDIIRKDKSLRPLFLPHLTSKGERVVIMKSEDVDVENFNHAAHIILCLMMADILFRESGPCSGVIFIYDLKHFTMNHMAKTSIIENARIFRLLNVLPIRLKSLRFINAPGFIDSIVNTLVKPFAPKKISERVSITSGVETLKDIPLTILPEEYGGTLDRSCSDIVYDQFKLCDQWEDWFKTEGTQIVDENKRPKDTLNLTSGHGVAGSFRKLNLD